MILNFTKWSKLYEQAVASTAISKIDFVVAAGASSKSMSDELLNTNQGYPTPQVKAATAAIYELTLADAINKNFSKAAYLGETAEGQNDQIIFENTSIVGSGKISIDWTPTNAAKKIKVSGNGALVLARAANEFNELLKAGTGVIQLELGASALYSKAWSMDRMGLTVANLQKSLKGIVYQAAVQVADPQLKPELVAKWNDFADIVELKYCPPIIEFDANGNRIDHRPTLEKNTALQSQYGKYSISDFTQVNGEKINSLSTIIKSNVIDPGLDAFLAYTENYLKEKLVGLDEAYLARFMANAKSNIEEAKANFGLGMIKTSLKNAVQLTPSGSVPVSPTQTSVKTTTYKEGESK